MLLSSLWHMDRPNWNFLCFGGIFLGAFFFSFQSCPMAARFGPSRCFPKRKEKANCTCCGGATNRTDRNRRGHWYEEGQVRPKRLTLLLYSFCAPCLLLVYSLLYCSIQVRRWRGIVGGLHTRKRPSVSISCGGVAPQCCASICTFVGTFRVMGHDDLSPLSLSIHRSVSHVVPIHV